MKARVGSSRRSDEEIEKEGVNGGEKERRIERRTGNRNTYSIGLQDKPAFTLFEIH